MEYQVRIARLVREREVIQVVQIRALSARLARMYAYEMFRNILYLKVLNG